MPTDEEVLKLEKYLFKKYFKKSEIIKIYSTEKFLNHTSSLKNRIYKYVINFIFFDTFNNICCINTTKPLR
mgnify:CR=1 FL=1